MDQSQYKPSVDGTVHVNGGVLQKPVSKMITMGSSSSSDFVVRILALILTLTAAVVAGVDKQTKIIPLTLLKTLPPLRVPVTANWSDMSAFV